MCSCAAKMLSHTNTLMFNDNKSDVRTTPLNVSPYTAQKMNFCIKDVFSKSWIGLNCHITAFFVQWYDSLTLFKMDILGLLTSAGCLKAPLPKICYAYPTTMKLGQVIPNI